MAATRKKKYPRKFYGNRRAMSIGIIPRRRKHDRHGNSAMTFPLSLNFKMLWFDRNPKTNAPILGPVLLDFDNLSDGNRQALERCEWGQDEGLDYAIEKTLEWLWQKPNVREFGLTEDKPKRSVSAVLSEEELEMVASHRARKMEEAGVDASAVPTPDEPGKGLRPGQPTLKQGARTTA